MEVDLISKAILKMIPENRGLQIFYAVFMSMDKVYDSELVKLSPMCVSFNPKTRKFELHISRDVLKGITNDPREVMFIIVHEMLHVILKHIFRLSKCEDRVIANMAADHVINTMILRDIEKNIIDGPVAPGGVDSINKAKSIPLEKRKYFIVDEISNSNMTFEEVYEYLSKNDKYNKLAKDMVFVDKLSDVIMSDESENEAMTILSEVKHIVESMVSKGSKTGSIFEAIKDVIYTKIPYEELLERAIRNIMVELSENRSWIRYQKKIYSSCGVIVPGFVPDETIERVLISIDTSGSMSLNDISKGIGIVKKLSYLGKIHEIEILYHDTDIKKNEVFKCEEIDSMELKEIPGRGGTSHLDVFNYIENNADINNVSLCIFFTDYLSDVDEIWNNYTFHSYIPTIFVVNNKNIKPHIESRFIYVE